MRHQQGEWRRSLCGTYRFLKHWMLDKALTPSISSYGHGVVSAGLKECSALEFYVIFTCLFLYASHLLLVQFEYFLFFKQLGVDHLSRFYLLLYMQSFVLFDTGFNVHDVVISYTFNGSFCSSGLLCLWDLNGAVEAGHRRFTHFPTIRASAQDWPIASILAPLELGGVFAVCAGVLTPPMLLEP